jgi:tetratricopeptide (TPR) repeat protein
MADVEERLTNIERRLELVRDELDALQIAAAEKTKPWLRQTPSLASLLALLVSIATAVYSGIERQRQDVEEKHNALRGLVSQLLDFSAEYQSKLASTGSEKLSTQEREFIGAMINSKRMVIAEAADNLVRQIPQTVTSAEYNFLANDKLANGGVAKAEEYLNKAVEVSRDALAKMNAFRNLAFFYAQRGPLQDMDRARKNFQQAVETLSGEPRDDATGYSLGFTWDMWGTAEYMNNYPKEGAQKFERARKYYSDLSTNNPTRKWALAFLEQRERGFTAPKAGPAGAALPMQSETAPFASPTMEAAPSAPPLP